MNDLQDIKETALSLMKEKGFPIVEDIELRVDESLPFMGYTTEENGQTVIVISRWSVTSGMVIGLLVHELSHVYRIESGHPSHNASLHYKVLQKVLDGKTLKPYQQEIVGNAINNLQDLYADDISFKVYFQHEAQKDMNEFFLGWIRTPRNTTFYEKDLWENAGALLNACFAQANIERHGVKDTGNKVAHAIERFLGKCEKRVEKEFEYFKSKMVSLPEECTEKEFEALLKEYLARLLHLTQLQN